MMDKIFYNALVKTMDNNNSVYEAVGIKDTKIAFLGSNKEAKKLKAEKKIDLKGKLLLPGFIDTHLHLLHYALAESMVKLNDCQSVEEIIDRGKKYLKKEGLKFGWLLGRGWNQNKFTNTDKFITKEDLDRITTEYPIFFTRVCGHMATVNSKGLEKIKSMEKASELDKYIDEKTGILTESAISLKTELYKNINIDEIKDLLIVGQKDLNKAGITSVHSADFSTLSSSGWEKIIKAYKSLEKENKLTVRTYEQAMFDKIELINDFINKGYKTGDGSEFFKIGPLKLLADGSLGARTAYMNEPYNDDQSTKGILIFSKEELREIFKKAHKNGLQIAVHAIGDGAIELNTELINELNKKDKPYISEKIRKYADINENTETNLLRHGIVHAQFTNEKIL
ncbi:MAG: amidohydrolase, partial [Bacillota bacterium]